LLSELLGRYGYYERWFLSSLHWPSICSPRARRGRSRRMPRTPSGDFQNRPSGCLLDVYSFAALMAT
jgi:hypothetical protein